MHPLARFAGLPPEGAARNLAPPPGELAPKATEGVHFLMHAFGIVIRLKPTFSAASPEEGAFCIGIFTLFVQSH